MENPERKKQSDLSNASELIDLLQRKGMDTQITGELAIIEHSIRPGGIFIYVQLN